MWWLALIVLGGLALRKVAGTSRDDVVQAQREAASTAERARKLYEDWRRGEG